MKPHAHTSPSTPPRPTLNTHTPHPLHPNEDPPSTQIGLCVSLAAEGCIRAVFVELSSSVPSAVVVTSATLSLFAWLAVTAVLMVERTAMLPSVATSGHGLVSTALRDSGCYCLVRGYETVGVIV